jgi:hypothetical protein
MLVKRPRIEKLCQESQRPAKVARMEGQGKKSLLLAFQKILLVDIDKRHNLPPLRAKSI